MGTGTYTQANYKHDHGLSNYRPSEEVEVHDSSQTSKCRVGWCELAVGLL